MSLYHSLGIAAESLFASRQGVDTAGHNIANAHTPGYSRQRIDLEQRIPSTTRGIIRGNGVFVKNITRAHDRFLENELNIAEQGAGASSSRYEHLRGLEGIYSPEVSATVADELTNFFNSLQELSSYPDELAVRTYVRESAGNLSQAFKRVDNRLRGVQKDINNRILGETEQISELTSQIAKLNLAIAASESEEGMTANDLRDKQENLVKDLSQRIDIHYYRSDEGMMTIRGPSESLLVDRGDASSIGTMVREDGSQFCNVIVIDSAGRVRQDITDKVRSGGLQGLLSVRDETINDLLHKNNMMAMNLALEVNKVHRSGFGINEYQEQVGRDFFQVGDDVNFAARAIRVSDMIAHSTDAIAAASSPSAPGDNVVVNNLLRLRDDKIMEDGEASMHDYYANYVGVLGLDVVKSRHTEEADKIMLADIKGRRESIAGVSLDEEAMNILRWQANFAASSKVITSVDEMLETVLGMKR